MTRSSRLIGRLGRRASPLLLAAALLLTAALSLVGAPPSAGARFHAAMLFRDSGIIDVSVSPSGEWVAAVLNRGGRYGVFAQRRGEAVTRLVHASRQSILSAQWVGADSLALELGTSGLTFPRYFTVLRFRPGLDDDLVDEAAITRRGAIVNVIHGEDELLLWAHAEGEASVVDRVSIEALAAPVDYLEGDDERYARVAEAREAVHEWVANANGVVFSFSSIEYDKTGRAKHSVSYRKSASAPWQTLWSGHHRDADRIEPLGVSADGRTLVVSAYAGNNTRGLHEYDPISREITRTIAMRSDVDVSNVVYDHSGTEIVGVGYQVGGHVQYDYIEGYTEKHLPEVAERVKEEGLRITSSSRDGQYFTLLSVGPRDPGTYYYYARPSRKFEELADKIPGVSPDRLPALQVIRAESSDGTAVEGFLTLPTSRKPGPKPLLVLPHGGPIGPADGGHFDPLVQYIALSGIAVLQVNFRGSGGYGRAFLEAGARQWGKGIEDDIDAVVQAAIDDGHVDPNRMCIAGGSYGGYSALISAIRRPDRYKCVGTIAGVTDIPLAIQGDRHSSIQAFREWHEQWVGDPESQMEELVAVSPVYRAGEIQAPVWIAQGGRDEVVDPEHAYRLRAMLDAHGKPFEWFFIEKGHHVPTATEWVRYASRLRTFLVKHLGRTRPHVANP